MSLTASVVAAATSSASRLPGRLNYRTSVTLILSSTELTSIFAWVAVAARMQPVFEALTACASTPTSADFVSSEIIGRLVALFSSEEEEEGEAAS